MNFDFKFPDVGEGLHEGRILELKKQPGDTVEVGEILAIVETDKVVAEIPSPQTGVLVEYGSAQGETIKVGETLALIATDGNGAGTPPPTRPASERPIVGALEVSNDEMAPSTELAEPDPATQAPSRREGPRATPAARRLARDLDVDLADVSGSGNGGRIQKDDIYAAAELEPAPAQAEQGPADHAQVSGPPTSKPRREFAFPLIDDPLASSKGLPPGQTVELTILRKTIAHNMELSRKIPTAIVHDLGEIDELVALREKVNAGRSVRVSFQPFFMKALATAVRKYPVLNSSFSPVTEEVTIYSHINIGFAVSTEAGLMVPVIHHVQNKTIREIDVEMKAAVAMAKDRTISAEDLRGGTVSLTNFGSFGGLYASPMILPPQVAIIGVGRIHFAAVVVEGSVQPRNVLPVSVAFDHRVVDGVPAASFVSYFLELLRAPQELFVSM